jgi:hypothetical protein
VVLVRNLLVSLHIKVRAYAGQLKGIEVGILQFLTKRGAKVLKSLWALNYDLKLFDARFFGVLDERYSLINDTIFFLEDDSIQTLNDVHKQIDIFTQMPFIWPFDLRVYLFRKLVDKNKLGHQTHYDNEQSSMKIRRDFLLEDAMKGFNSKKQTTGVLTGPIRIAYVDEFGGMEAGIDGGGLYREFLYDLSKALLNPEYGLFEQTDDDQTLRPNVDSRNLAGENHLKYFWFAGVVVGRAIFDGILIDSVFSRFLLHRMLGELNFLPELQYYD